MATPSFLSIQPSDLFLKFKPESRFRSCSLLLASRAGKTFRRIVLTL